MTVEVAPSSASAEVRASRSRWRTRAGRHQQRLLDEQDRVSARAAELYHLYELLLRAERLVDDGWVQRAWFACRDEKGEERLVTERTRSSLAGRPVTGACLVGAVVESGGGLSQVGSQPVQRALDLTWHTLFVGGPLPQRWCLPPATRAAHLRQLTGWNDRPERRRDEVVALLGASAEVARHESRRLGTQAGTSRHQR